MTHLSILSCTLVLAFNAPASADPPPEIAAQIREWGRATEAWPRTRAIYTPMHGAYPSTVVLARDVPYGSHPAQLIDIFSPAQASTQPRRVLLFIPGGGFNVGQRTTQNGPFYHNVGVWAAQNGMIGIVMGHRVLPDHPYPGGQEDVQSVLNWIADNAERLGVATNRVAVMGFSVGASHLAAFAGGGDRFRARVQPDRYVFVSGYYDHQGAPASVHAYFGTDAEQGRVRLPGNIRERPEPMLVVSPEFDPQVFTSQADGFERLMCDAGRCPNMLRLKNQNHVSQIFGLGTGDMALAGPLLRFLQGE